MAVCETCHQKIRLAHKENLNKNLLTGLQQAARRIAASGVNDIDINEFIDDTNIYNNFQKLRYFGLIHHYRNNDVKVRGHWLITRNGWRFLRGDIKVHKWVKVQNNSIIEHSPELIDVRSVYYGSDIITTTFEYFDENNRPVGFRPLADGSQQLSLI